MTEQPRDEKAVFLAALEKDSATERDSYVRDVCGDDLKLFERVQTLLAAHNQSAGPLDTPPPGIDVSLSAADELDEQPGTEIGHYKLLQQIGEGGMGAVYMAEQSEPVERRVALKIIKPGMDTRKVIARFEAERQALAMMDHPNIAKVLDAGATETGRPYFVMELVKGVPVTQYCDNKQLTPRQRLELFVPICQAIQHAHQKGVIHRDIKPSNVLVAEYDDRPVPKIIDFGVAKAIEQRLTEKTMFTEYGQVVGTVEYMSPEQAKLNQQDIDTRTDVYSLGVLLYELLTGETPFDRESLRSAAFDELLRIIREEEPPRPSLKIDSSESLPSIAADRHVEPKQLSATVHGELDWIVMKALEKDRSRRYDTASKFAEDVQHYLNDEAVAACPPSVVYQFRKFARRNKTVMTTTAAIVAALIVGTSVATWQAIRAMHERDRALIAEALADEEAERADAEAKQALLEAERAAAAERVALTEAERADEGERIARINLHASRIDLAEQELIASRNGQALRILNDARPKSGQEDLRGFAWHHLWSRANERLIQTHTQDPQVVEHVELSPDGMLIAAAGRDGVVRIWDRESEQEVTTLQGHSGLVRSLSFSSDSKLIASGDRDGNVIIWNAVTGLEECCLEPHPDAVVAVAFAPGGRLLASRIPDSTVRIWSLSDATLRNTLYAPVDKRRRGYVSHILKFSPDGSLLAADIGNDRLNLWEVETGRIRHQLSSADSILAADFSPDSRHLATDFGERQVVIWNVKSGKKVLVSNKLIAYPRCLNFASNGSSLAIGFDDGTLINHDLLSGRSIQFAHDRTIRSVSYSTDNSTVLSADSGGRIKLWKIDSSPKAVLSKPPSPSRKVWAMAFSPDGKTLAYGEGLRVQLMETSTGRITAELPTAGNTLGIMFSPKGDLIAQCGGAGVELWDVQSQKLLTTLHKVTDEMHMYAVAFSPDGRILATSGKSGTITLYDVATHTQIAEMQAPEWVWSLSFSPDGNVLASGGGSGESSIRLWCWQTQKQQEVIRKGFGPVMFSSDGKALAFQSSSYDGIRLWDVEKKQSRTIGGRLRQIYFAQSQFSLFPDGKRLAMVGNGRVTLWDVSTGQKLPMFRKFPHWVFSVAVSPDGQTVATGGSERGAQLWRSTLNHDGLAYLPSLPSDQGTEGIISFSPSADQRKKGLVPFSPLERLTWRCEDAIQLIETGKHDQSEVYLRDAMDLLDRVADENDMLTALGVCLETSYAIQQLGSELSDLQTKFAAKISEQCEQALQKLHDDTEAVLQRRAHLYAKLQAWDEAAADWAHVIELSTDAPGFNSPRKIACRELARWPDAHRRVVKLRPDDAALWIGLGQYHALHSQWDDARTAYQNADLLQPVGDATFEYAGVLLNCGAKQVFQEFCAELSVKEPQDSFTAFQLARICGLAPKPDVKPHRLLAWAKQGVTEKENAWELHVLGLAQFRAGELEQAIKSLETSNTGNWPALAKTQNDLVLAMTHHALGDNKKSRQILLRASKMIDEALPPHVGEPVNLPIPDWIGIEALRREAERLIQLSGNAVDELQNNKDIDLKTP